MNDQYPSQMPSAVDEDLAFNWKQKFEQKALSADDFRRHWAKTVPFVYHPNASKQNKEEFLFIPMERFIAGSKDVSEVFKNLKLNNNLCRKILKPEELMYSCQECSLDPTCVLCHDCFTNSEHRNHHFKMNTGKQQLPDYNGSKITSGVGAFCKCGDKKAWKSFSKCTNHHDESQSSATSSSLNKLSTDLVLRFQIVLKTVIEYCHTMLTCKEVNNLPSEWTLRATKISEDTYCTIILKDDIYPSKYVMDDVIRAISHFKKLPINFVYSIQEERIIVKWGSFSECECVRHFLESISSKYYLNWKAIVMHTELISHQTFALKLLDWLQKIFSLNKGFCHAFTNVIMKGGLLKSIMLTDSHLWKMARKQWHQFIISGMLMDTTCKKAFAKSFLSVYPTLMREFIGDDREHSSSVTSLSLQLFTVPELAHSLIQEENAVSVVLRTLLSEYERHHLNAGGKLHFQSRRPFVVCTFYMLYDLSYLVKVRPPEWNDQLRKNVRSGMQSFFTLLDMMQDMDPHVQREYNWEGLDNRNRCHNLQRAVCPVTTLLLKLCCNDYSVYVRILQANIKHFQTSQQKNKLIRVELSHHSVSCIEYDVATEPVSIHLPLVRFMAGLLLHMDKFGLSYNKRQLIFENLDIPSPMQLLELPLRSLVKLAQFRARMNDDYIDFDPLYSYERDMRSLKDEMFERDILMLQIVASMMESNEFLIHLVYKFGLLNWAAESFDSTSQVLTEEKNRYNIIVAEEFLILLLALFSERFTPRLGKVAGSESIKKEIIQLLCIEPMPYSSLLKLLPKDLTGDMGIEAAIKEMTILKLSTGIKKYELKPEYYEYFNPFYCFYTREKQSKALEAQLTRKKNLHEKPCFPPPVAPEFTPRFSIIINLLQCDVMLHIMELVLRRTLNVLSPALSKKHVEIVMHLIGIALHEEERIVKVDKANSVFCFTSKANQKGFVNLLEECLDCPKVDDSRELQDLISWIVAKFKFVESLYSLDDGQMSDFAVVSGWSRISTKDQTLAETQMTIMQKSFIKEQIEDRFSEGSNLLEAKTDMSSELTEEDQVCVFRKSKSKVPSPSTFTCILCQEHQELSSSDRALVLPAFVQRSSVLSKNCKHRMRNDDSLDPLQLPADLFWSVHVSTCGHVMHSDCWEMFFDYVVHSNRQRLDRFDLPARYNVEKKEFLCPLCDRLSNCVIPLVPPLPTLTPPEVRAKDIDILIDEWLKVMEKVCEGFVKNYNLPEMGQGASQFPFYYNGKTLEDAAKDISEDMQDKFRALFSSFEVETNSVSGTWAFSEDLINMMELFSEAVFTVSLNSDINRSDERIPSLSWFSGTYTIQAIEQLLRNSDKALFGAHSSRNALCLDSVIRFCGTSLCVFDHAVVRTNCVRMLHYLLLGDHYLSSPQCCLDLDAFSVLAFLVLAMPVLFEPSGQPGKVPVLHPLVNVLDKHLLHLMLVFHLVQVLLTYPFQEEAEMSTDPSGPLPESLTSLSFYKAVHSAAGFPLSDPVPSGITIDRCLKTGSLPFLRCAALFFSALTDTPLQKGENGESFEGICTYLGLPSTLHELLEFSSLKDLASSWARHPRTLHLLLNPDPTESESLVRHPLSVNQLVPLPVDYCDLINIVSHLTCTGNSIRNPTMCLVCGEILCSQSYCCQWSLGGTLVGACSFHAQNCGFGVGIFLRIWDCQIVLLSDKNKGCFIGPPYVDDYGETDQGLYRGNPLHLCTKRYAELHELWLSHNIPEKVSHNMEQSPLNDWLLPY